MNRIVLISPYIIPRRIPFYTKLDRIFNDDPDTTFTTVLIKRKPVHRKHRDYYDDMPINKVLCKTRQFYLSKQELALDVTVDLYKILSKLKPTLLIFEGFGLSYMQGYLYARMNRVKTVFWNKSSSILSITNSGFRDSIKKAWINQHSYFLAGGQNQRKYVERYVSKQEVLVYNDTIDTISIKNKVRFDLALGQPKGPVCRRTYRKKKCGCIDRGHAGNG